MHNSWTRGIALNKGMWSIFALGSQEEKKFFFFFFFFSLLSWLSYIHVLGSLSSWEFIWIACNKSEFKQEIVQYHNGKVVYERICKNKKIFFFSSYLHAGVNISLLDPLYIHIRGPFAHTNTIPPLLHSSSYSLMRDLNGISKCKHFHISHTRPLYHYYSN